MGVERVWWAQIQSATDVSQSKQSNTLYARNTQLCPSVNSQNMLAWVFFSCKTSMETNSLEVLRNLLQLLPRAAHSWTHSEKTHTLEYTQMIEFSLTVKNSKTPISPAAKNVSVISSRRPLLCARGHTRAESNNSTATRPPTVWAEMEANWLLVGGLICHHLFCLISLW